ncbi:MAG: type IV pilus twitching motility protein PilT [Desulfobacterales bacterium]|nr:type IV pilus twitching motility protein PilT [Desulfobacterales bacterium]
MVELNTLLRITQDRNASDLHLTDSMPPILRIHGELVRLDEFGVLYREDLEELIYEALTEMQLQKFRAEKELDFSYGIQGGDRFRVNIHIQQGNVEAAFRRIPNRIPPMDELNLPDIAYELARKPHGLVLITGPTGTGKSTTMASMIDMINGERSCVIISIEDPIEYVHTNRLSIIKQREVFSDTNSFPEALKRVLRQDPDIIVVGEMRDLETISTALTAAETGHLVFATLHTPDAPQTIERIIDVFPPHQQNQVRLQLASCLQGVISQILMPKARGNGRILATEIFVGTPAVRNLIREKDIAKIPNVIQTGAQYGMRTMDTCLNQLVTKRLITKEVAKSKAKYPQNFN